MTTGKILEMPTRDAPSEAFFYTQQHEKQGLSASPPVTGASTAEVFQLEHETLLRIADELTRPASEEDTGMDKELQLAWHHRVEKSAGALGGIMLAARDSGGIWQIDLPRRLTTHNNAYSSLLADYEADDGRPEGEPSIRLSIPASKVNRATCLPYNQLLTERFTPEFELALNMQITTSSDRLATVMEMLWDRETGSKKPAMVPVDTNGNWYHFPLRQVGISLEGELDEPRY